MANRNYMTDDDLINNPTTRIPVVLCLDVSRSMTYHNGILQLKQGINQFYEELKKDDMARYSAEISIVTFSNQAQVEEDFSLVDTKSVPILETGGNTLLGSGVLLALKTLEERKKRYQRLGIDYYQPWLIIMTDGSPHGESVIILKEAQKEASVLEAAKKLVVVPIGIGPKTDMETLNKFSSRFEAAVHLSATRFSDFFIWLSKSVSAIASSKDIGVNLLDLSEVKEWGDI